MRIEIRHIYLVILSFLAIYTEGGAQTNPLAPALGFNVFTSGNVEVSGGSIEGAIGAGGNFRINGTAQIIGNNSGTGNPYVSLSGANYAMMVGGNITYTTGTFNINGNNSDKYVRFNSLNGGTVSTSGTNVTIANGTPRIQINNTAQTGTWTGASLVNFTTALNTMRTTSYDMASMANNVFPYYDSGNPNPNIALNNGINVWNINGWELGQWGTISFENQPSVNRILIINVNANGAYDWAVPTLAGIGRTTGAEYIIWNFYSTTTLNIPSGGDVVGSVLATNAYVYKSSSSDVYGQVICSSLKHDAGEMRIAHFDATLTLPQRVPIVLPSSATLTNPSSAVNACHPGNNMAMGYYANGSSYAEFEPVSPLSFTYASGTGTVTITGQVRQIGFPNRLLNLSYTFSGETNNPLNGSPHWHDCKSPNTLDWRYFPTTSGTITGSGDFAGLSISISRTWQPPFQIGMSANTTNSNFGGSAWMLGTTNSLPWSGTYYFATVGNSVQFDLEFDFINSCPNVTSAGTIGSPQSGNCTNPFNPSVLTETAAPVGGSGTLEYQWQYSVDGVNWLNISGATAQTYDPPSISTTTFYRRGTRRAGCNYVYTNTVTINVTPTLTAVATNDGNFCVGQTIGLSLETNVAAFNMVANGDFEQNGYYGFNTDVSGANTSVGFTTDPNITASWAWPSVKDNTSGYGRMMYFSDDNAGTNKRQWYQSYAVTSGSTYSMSVWVHSIYTGIPNLYWSVNGTQVGTSISPATASGWVQLTTTWVATTTGTATFAVVLAQNNWDRDFVLDDVVITRGVTTYSWTGPSSFTSSLQNPFRHNATTAMSGTYNVTVSANGCTASSSTTLSVSGTACSVCPPSAVNVNGDLEQEGTATNFNLTFQGTPARLVDASNRPLGWEDLYGSSITNTSTFQGAFYLKKTGAAGNPRSGTHMMYMKGSGYCLGALQLYTGIACGKTYRFGFWAAAYTNGATQNAAPFRVEYMADGSNAGGITTARDISLPASTSWNSLNWQYYYIDIVIPENGYEHINFYFTSVDNNNGVVLDDVCITEISDGASANAGADQSKCTNTFTLAANTPPTGFTGVWSVTSGSATISNINSPTATATVSSTAATLRWTVTSPTGCNNSDDVTLGYVPTSISVNNGSVCSSSSATLTVTGCTGNVLWSTGATTSSITVTPSVTTNYTVTCTPTASSNLVQNPSFESATNLQNWSDWGSTAITTTAADVQNGTKAAKITTSGGNGGGFAQDIAISPGLNYTLTAWGKINDMTYGGNIIMKFLSPSWEELSIVSTRLTTNGYTQYTLNGTAPEGTAWVQIAVWASSGAILSVDNFVLTRNYTNCTATATSTVTACCPNVTDAGYIEYNETSSVSPFDPANITSGAPATGGTGAITYQWQLSTDLGITWTNISGATGLSYDPSSITQTTWYRRLARSGTCSWMPSNEVRKAIIPTTPNNCTIESVRTVGNISKCSGSKQTKTSLTLSLLGDRSTGGTFGNYNHEVMPGATMTEYCDGTALITGRVCASDGRGALKSSTACFDFTYRLTGRTTTLPLGKTATTGCENQTTTNWYYYSGSNEGTLVLRGVAGTDYEGAVMVIYGNQDHYFQIGDGASHHIEGIIGAGLWGEPVALAGGINNIRPQNDGQDMDFQIALGERIVATVSDTVCQGNSAIIAVNSAVCTGATYSWTGPNGFTSTQRNPTIAASFLNNGLNHFYVTVSGSGTSCSAIGYATVLVNPAPTVSATANTVCAGGTINLTSSGSSSIITLAPTTTELVAVNARTFNPSCTGCFSTDVPSGSWGYTTNPPNIYSGWVSTGDQTTGTGSMLYFTDDNTATNRRQWYNTYTVTPNTTYKMSFWARNVLSGGQSPTLFWTVNGTQIDSFITPHFTNGWVKYEATWFSGNQSGSRIFAIVLFENDVYSDFVIDEVSIQATSLTSSTSTSTAGTYSWSGPSAFTSSVQNPNRASTTTAMSGVYTVTFTNSKGCTATATATATVNSGASITTQPAGFTQCVGGAQALTVTAAGAGLTYQWQSSPNNSTWTNISGATATTYTPPSVSEGTTYYRVVVSTPSCGSVNSNSATVIVSSCIGSVGNYVWTDTNNDGINNEAASAGINSVPVQLYTSANTLVASTVTSNDVSGNPGYYNFVVTVSGSYYIKFPTNFGSKSLSSVQITTAATDNNNDANASTGNSAVFTINIMGTGVAKDNPTIDAGYRCTLSATATSSNIVNCTNSATTLTATPTNGVTYAWSNGATTQTQSVSVAGLYRVTVTDIANGCVSSASVVVTVTPMATVGNYVWTDTNGNGLNDEAASAGINGLTVELWNNTTNTLVGTTTTASNAGNPGYYQFCVTSTDSYYVKFPIVNGTGRGLTIQTTTAATDNNSDAHITTGQSPVFTLNVSGIGTAKNNMTIDAGYKAPCPTGNCVNMTITKTN